MARVAPLVRSVTLMFDHMTAVRVAVRPPGQSSTEAAAGTLGVSEPTRLPFWPAVKTPLSETSELIVVFLGSAGTLPPPLTHWKVASR
jgi:hypothetical protein